MDQNLYLIEGQRMVQKHTRLISAVDKALKENASYGKGLDQYKKITLAQLLENTSNAYDLYKAMNEAAGVQVTAIAPKNDYLNLVTAVVPTLVAEDIVSVQPLKQKAGVAYYLKTTYGSTKGKITDGDVISQIDRVWAANTDAAIEFSSEDVTDEAVVVSGSTTKSFTLAWTPVIPGSVSFISNATGNAVITDKDKDTKLYSGTTQVGSVDYSTGAVTILEAQNTNVPKDSLVTYQLDLLTSPVDNVPEIKTTVTDITLTARPRKLKTVFGMDAAFDLMATQNIDLQSLLQENTTNEIRNEIDGEILRDLGNNGGSLSISWNKQVPFGISKVEHYDSFYQTLVEGANKVFNQTRRVTANIVICGEYASNVIETHRLFNAAASMNEAGPHIMGTLNNRFIIVKNPYYASNKFTMCYKGDVPFDCNYVYAPYMPVTATQFIMGADFSGSRGYATSYAKRLIANAFFCNGLVTDVAA